MSDRDEARRMLDYLPVLSWRGLPDASKDFFNRRWHEFTGLSPKEAHRSGWHVTIHPEDMPAVARKWQEVLDGASVVGGRVCNFAGRRVALTFYDLQGRRMSLFVTDRDDELRAGCSEGVRGFTICREPAHGLAYALVTDLPADEVQPLLRTGLEQLH